MQIYAILEKGKPGIGSTRSLKLRAVGLMAVQLIN
jgi:hypothetical protein